MSNTMTDDEMRKHVADAFIDAHHLGHWTCVEEECHQTTGSPINQVMALIHKDRAARQSIPDQELDTFLDEVLQELLDDFGLGSWRTGHLGVVKAKTRLHERFAAERSRLVREAVEAGPADKDNSIEEFFVDKDTIGKESAEMLLNVRIGFNNANAEWRDALQSLQTQEEEK